MKNFKIAFYLLLTITLLSCGSESVRDTKNEPFVIMKITKTYSGKFIYSKGKFDRPQLFVFRKQSIETDYDAGYKIGDTLTINCH